MNEMSTQPSVDRAPSFRLRRNSLKSAARLHVFAVFLLGSFSSHAVDFGPDGMFSLTGFAKFTLGAQTKYCKSCQIADSNVSKQIHAADAIAPGQSIDSANNMTWIVHPYLTAKQNLGGGYELSGMLSQRWRDSRVNGQPIEARYGGKVDVPNYWYDKNIAIKHDDYGSVRIGSMTTRSWALADYPYGTNIGLADAWANSGAGYGMLANAIRMNAPMLDVADGDLFLELTYDRGNDKYKRLSPYLIELYAQYHKGDLVVDAVYQNAVNGGPGAWGHAPFSAITPYTQDDAYKAADGTQFDNNRQSIILVMARYQYNTQIELTGGIRRNSWSGNDLVFNPATQWTAGFNVGYTNPLGPSYPGYSANSFDYMFGVRYRSGKWIYSAGGVYLGKAYTSNPSERGQSNSALINTLGARYEYSKNIQLEATVGNVSFSRQGLAPMSMPGNSSFTNVDSRIAKDGQWVSIGFVHLF
jgi:hypothetical protein